MTPITFKLDGETYEADYDELTSYRTSKQFAQSETNPGGMFEAMSRIFMGRDEEYIDAIGGDIASMGRLCDAAFKAAQAKNSSASPETSKATGAK